MGSRKNSEFWLYVFITPGIIGFLFFWLIPIIQSFALSFCNYDVFSPTKFVGWNNYIYLVKDNTFWISLGNTLFMLFASVPVNLVVALGLALLLNTKISGMHFFRTIFYIPTLLPLVATAVMAQYLFDNRFGLLNLLLANMGLQPVEWLTDASTVKITLVLLGAWGVGRTMIIYLAGLQGIPDTYYEAAEMDGANPASKFFRITLPMLTPSILYNIILEAVNAF